jgi:hypothetical protein
MEARSPARGDAPERFLAERLAEELELTQEARERRAELVGQLQDEIEQGKSIDLAALSAETLPDFARRIQILGGGNSEGAPSER